MNFQDQITRLLEWRSIPDAQFMSALQAFIGSQSLEEDAKGLPSNMIPAFVRLLDVIQELASKDTEDARDFRQFLRKTCPQIEIFPSSLMVHNVEIEGGPGTMPIAGGRSCDIYKGRIAGIDQCVAIKIVREHVITDEDKKREGRKALYREGFYWKQLHHPNMYPFLGLSIEPFSDGRPCLVSPWSNFGEVDKFLSRYPEHDRLKIVEDVAEGLYYLHNRDPPFVHGDLKTGSIMIELQ